MGARQVLRVAGLVALIAAAPAPARADVGDEPVVIVDLRPGDAEARRASRAALSKELGGVAGIVVRADPVLDGALAGEAADADAIAVRAALDEARAAFGALDCGKARPAAERAIDLLAARQAAGLDDGPALRGAWAYVLLCAEQGGDRARAQLAADRLRGLGVTRGEEAGIAEATWTRYPEIDASTDRDIVALTIETDPAGAAVWVDHVAVGAAPVTVHVPAGEHVVAAGEGGRRGAARVTVGGKPATTRLTLADQRAAYSDVAGVIAAWRDGVARPDAEALATVLASLEVRVALVLAGTDRVELWGLPPRATKARKLDTHAIADTLAIGATVLERVAAWDGTGPDPDQPIIYEKDLAARGARGTPQRWWVYAAIVGAVAAGTAVLYFQDAADDHQRIEIRWP